MVAGPRQAGGKVKRIYLPGRTRFLSVELAVADPLITRTEAFSSADCPDLAHNLRIDHTEVGVS